MKRHLEKELMAWKEKEEHPLSLHKQVLSIPLYMIGFLERFVRDV